MEKQIKLQKRILAVILSVLLAGGNLQAGSFSVQASGVDETLPAVGQARASAHSHAGWTAWSNTSKMPDTAGNYYLTVAGLRAAVIPLVVELKWRVSLQ